MISNEYLDGMNAATRVWPLREGAVVKNPHAGFNDAKAADFNAGFYETVKTLTVIDLMKKKDEHSPPTEFEPYRGFKVGDAVQKVEGYAFPGTIVGLFLTSAGGERCVVELQVDGAGPVLHIFNLGQIAHAKSAHQDG